MKNILVILLVLYSGSLFSAGSTILRPARPWDSYYKREQHQGQVITLNAPLFEKPDIDSKIVQRMRKGDLIYIKKDLSGGAPFKPNYQLVAYYEGLSYNEYIRGADIKETVESKSGTINKDNLKITKFDFYQTIDRLGKTAYVPKVFIKPLYKDSRELSDTVNRFEHDPTDYRKPEPLGKHYPFVKVREWKTLVNAGIGSPYRSHYHYPNDIEKENYGPRIEIFAMASNRVNYDNYDRTYFGFMGEYSTQSTKIGLFNENISREKLTRLGVGPYMSWDGFRSQNWQATFYGGLIFYPINKIAITQNINSRGEEIRTFKSYMVSPRIGALYQLLDVIEDLDLNIAIHMAQPLGPNMKPQQQKEFTNDTWRIENDDRINHRFVPEFSFTIGFQSSY
ncbi:MAG: hypothetical protein HOE90_01730 [Bacteriovoracaceae bacterium]|jgi:predicted SnoaL-like aldol condensation-catalyzing enzyme|nr:hypothetical protein [Bacteriovoracaceae bacterium]